ncbi:MAG TPA: YdcF family protein [Candidatus Saccharimonadales bacterium]|nr:YdcF family protein [Candidatus Saccharimonadales bacterium]
MIRLLMIIILSTAAIIVALSLYLQPDNLADCEAIPGTSVRCQPVDAIVAVSGGNTAARTHEAIKLFKNGWSDTLILSGAAQDKSGPSNAAAMRTIALSEGVPASSIYLDEYSETTKQNAENTQTIFADRKIKSVILVTSGYHQRRAGLEFNKRASDVVILNHPARNDSDWSIWWWTTPRGWYLAVSEFTKIIAFYVVGTR